MGVRVQSCPHTSCVDGRNRDPGGPVRNDVSPRFTGLKEKLNRKIRAVFQYREYNDHTCGLRKTGLLNLPPKNKLEAY